MLKLARPIPQLTAEQVVILTLLSTATRPMKPDVIERSMGPRGQRFSIASALEALEDHKLVVRERPAPASPKYALAEDGQAKLEEACTPAYNRRVVKDLDDRVKRLSTPHPRDGSCLDEDAMGPYRHLRNLLTGAAKFSDGRRIDPEMDEDADQEASDAQGDPEGGDEDAEALGGLQEPREKPRKGSLAFRQAQQRRKPTEKRVPLRTQDPRSQAQPTRRPSRPGAGSSAGGPAAGSPQRPKPRRVQSVETGVPQSA